MNGIIINDKQYIFLKTNKSVDCRKCDLDEDDVCNNSVICESSTTCYMVVKELECLRN